MKERSTVDSLSTVTPLLLTYNEEANIGRTLNGLKWAKHIVVVDSGSTDGTLEIIAQYPQAVVVTRTFDNFADQSQFGVSHVSTAWCLSLDADHVVTSNFQNELETLIANAPADLAAILTPFQYLVHGRPLRGSLLPPRFNLFRPGFGAYVNDGHGHFFQPNGRTISMTEPLQHDDRKPLGRWLDSQRTYMNHEVQKLLSTPPNMLNRNDRLRLKGVIAPFAVLALCLIWHRGLLDGWRGWFYAFQRVYAEVLLSLMIWERRATRCS